jgi:hypothetical protein
MKNIEGNCALCGQLKKLSFEHVPPQSAFNDKPIFIQAYEHLLDQESNLYGKKMRSNRGFGGYTLCEDCNKSTGNWYARDFIDFAKQGMEAILSLEIPQYLIKGTYIIKPLNVLKQIITMFMSADKSGHLRSQKDLIDFVLNKEVIGLPKKYKIYLYYTLSSKKRMIGYTIIYDPKLEIQKWCEINFQPFGYLLAEESSAAHEHMSDISDFGNFNYDQKLSIELTTVYLNVESPEIGTYK